MTHAAAERADGLPIVLTGHLHVGGGDVSTDSERRIVIGGEEAEASTLFDARVAYVALGHLHRPQNIPGATVILVAKPRVIYVDETLLDRDKLLEEAKDLLCLGEDDEMPATLRTAAAPLRKHAGKHCSTSAHFVVDSVLHSTEASGFWMDEFESRLNDLASDAREVSNGDRERARVAEAAHVVSLAKRLSADPAFHYGKTSAAKRHLLATAMFPEEDGRLLDEVVDLAQRLDWLEQSGFTRGVGRGGLAEKAGASVPRS